MSKDPFSDDPAEPEEHTLLPIPNGDREVYVAIPASKGIEPEEAAREASYYLETLKANRQVAEEPDPLGPDQTHRIETDKEGRRVLRRKRFTAL